VFDKVIALPPGFMALTPLAERDLALEHELEHHRGRDLAINIAVQPLLALHWFNPLGWLGWKALRRDQEAACDARVLAGREAETRAIYGRLIASFAVHPSPALASPLACPINLEKSIIYRLRSLTMTEPTKTRRLAGRLLIGAAALALPLTATISYAANEPAPPAPPAPPVHPAGVQAHEVLIETVGKSEAGQPPKIRKIVIVEKSSDGGDLVTRTETRGERTYVFKTAKPLSDAEVEKRIAGIDQGQMVSADKFVVSAAPDGAKRADQTVVIRHGDGLAPEKKVERREVRTAITHFESSGNVVAAVLPECPTGTRSTHVQTADEGQGGKTRHVRVVVCAHDGDPQGRLHGLRSARAKVADNPDIPAETKTEVLGQLDAEIEKAAKRRASALRVWPKLDVEHKTHTRPVRPELVEGLFLSSCGIARRKKDGASTSSARTGFGQLVTDPKISYAVALPPDQSVLRQFRHRLDPHQLHAPLDLVLQDRDRALHAVLPGSGEGIEVEPPA
jgi:bla regulator protein BlaR1